MTADSLQKQIQAPDGHLFQKGRSGNPAGRRPGTRNRATQAVEVLLEGEAEALTRRAIELAFEGDATVLKLCLERIVPRLKIAERCSFGDKFLIVRGNLRTYKIHLGSGNILMPPNDQYLCIVPKSAADDLGAKVFLPFEGDNLLSIILSKAFLLADDSKIKDPTIVNQIRAR